MTHAEKIQQAHEFNLDAAYREIEAREAMGEDMSTAYVNETNYAVIKPLRKWVIEFTIHSTNKNIVNAAKWAKETFYSLEECEKRILHHINMGRFCSYTEYLA